MKQSEATELRELVSLLDSVSGIYSRVAKQLDVSPSLVSRVARGQRRSKSVEGALKEEWKKLKTKGIAN